MGMKQQWLNKGNRGTVLMGTVLLAYLCSFIQRLEIWISSYEKMSYLFLLAGNQESNWPCEKRLFPFFARKVQEDMVERIIDQINPTRKKTIIFF